MSKINIMDLFSEGEENAITAKELAKILNWSEREVTLCINAMRNSGKIICATGSGYFLPSTLYEVTYFYRSMQSRIREIERAAQSAKEYIVQNGGEV